MFRRNRYRIFYVECEFLLDDFKRFSRNFTEKNAWEKLINIFLACFVTNLFLIVVWNWERRVDIGWGGFRRFRVPIPFLFFYLYFRHRKIFLCDRFIVTEGTQFMRKEFSPFSGGSHMVDDFSGEGFVFSDGIGFVEDAIFLMLEGNTAETICARLAVVQIHAVITSPGIRAEEDIIRWKWAETFIAPFTRRIVTVVGIFRSSAGRDVLEFFSFGIIETRETI